MRLDLGNSIISLVKAKFASAKLDGRLIFSSTELAIVRAGGLSYQLRYCPALSKKREWEKPVSPSSAAVERTEKDEETKGTRFDPFLDPPQALLVAELPPGHVLVLNKYPVIPNHFILATKAYKDQRKLLEQDDLAATWACLRAWEAEDGEEAGARGRTPHERRLFAFFNSGEDSGASQPHRHIQFLPVDDMEGDAAGQGWRLPLDEAPSDSNDHMTSRSSLGFPFVHLTAPLRPSLAPCDVHDIYMTLYGRAVSAVRAYNADRPAQDAIETVDDGDGEGWSEISYNLALTTSAMALCPRRAEDAYIEPRAGQGHEGATRLGPISLNGTILAANLMVKSEPEWAALRADESKLCHLLATVGLPLDGPPQRGSPESRL